MAPEEQANAGEELGTWDAVQGKGVPFLVRRFLTWTRAEPLGNTSSTMVDSANTSDGLGALAKLLTDISVNSFDICLHVRHINLARSLEMGPQVLVAQEMAASYIAVGDDVWLPIIEAKLSSANLENPADVLEVLKLYARAEADYLCA